MAESDAQPVIVARSGLQACVDVLRAEGYTVIAPVIREGAIVYDEVAALDDLPAGWTDEQDAGHYRLRRRDDEALFGFAVGPQSWEKIPAPGATQAVARRTRWRRHQDRRCAASGTEICLARRTQLRIGCNGDPRHRVPVLGACRRRLCDPPRTRADHWR